MKKKKKAKLSPVSILAISLHVLWVRHEQLKKTRTSFNRGLENRYMCVCRARYDWNFINMKRITRQKLLFLRCLILFSLLCASAKKKTFPISISVDWNVFFRFFYNITLLIMGNAQQQQFFLAKHHFNSFFYQTHCVPQDHRCKHFSFFV